MLKKRIIACLDIQEGRTVKGIQFKNIRDAGDPVELAKLYTDEGIDELVFLDITATAEKRKTLLQVVEKIARVINIPFTVGGGISSVDDAKRIIEAGADKVSVNSAAVRNPNLISAIAGTFGSQCVVLAIDTQMHQNSWNVYTGGGRWYTEKNTLAWAKEGERLGAGEILLTSMEHDGAKKGFAVDLLARISQHVGIPVIASGGAGQKEHFKTVFTETKVSAALAASVFHFGTITIPELKQYLKSNNIAIR